MPTVSLNQLATLLRFLAAYPQHHARTSDFYGFVDRVVAHAFRDARPDFEAGRAVNIGELGPVVLPYEKMGAVDSIDLFGLDELIIFAFYYRNRGNYRRAADIGANIGLHSILMSRCGFDVDAYEPDPHHYALLERNLLLNRVERCMPHMAAVSGHRGKMQFVRVIGNTTSSHLLGAKANPYGDLEQFEVDVVDMREISARIDLMKIDAEGHESTILGALPIEAWNRIDAFVEVGSDENARSIFAHFKDSGINIFCQKQGWRIVHRFEEMPKSYREGGIFISAKPNMPW